VPKLRKTASRRCDPADKDVFRNRTVQNEKRSGTMRQMNLTQYIPNSVESFLPVRVAIPLALLICFWLWETLQPFFTWRQSRYQHAFRNLALALFNTVLLAVCFAAATVFVAGWTTEHQVGLLNVVELPQPVRFLLGLLLLDAWMYLWHRVNHTLPLLWRLHRMHHSDNRMDVTSAMRFHIGELSLSAILRLGLVPLLGLSIWQIVIYDLLINAITQFHHANISLGGLDRWLRFVIVTPDMHKVHHSRVQQETDSNYSSVLSIWDRLARSFRFRDDPKTIDLGLDDFDDDRWQTFTGMLKTPWRKK